MESIKYRTFFIFTAVLINISVFAAIPRLSNYETRPEPISVYDPVFIAEYTPLPPPMQNRQQPKPPEPKERIIKKFTKPVLKPQKITHTQPRINIKISAPSFEINPMLATGMSIAPPPPEPIAQIREPQSAPLPVIPSEFSIGEVDQAPQILQKIDPVYPYRAKRRNIKGSVTVKFLVSPSGYVEKVSVVKADPKGIFEKNVLQAIKQWKFKPGIWQGKPVPTWVVVPIQFTLDG